MRLATGLAFFAGLAVATGLAAMDRKTYEAGFAGCQAERIAREGRLDREFPSMVADGTQSSSVPRKPRK